MTVMLICTSVLYIAFLLREAYAVHTARKVIGHVVHVNGTRGKSTVSRLIEAGLRAGDLRVFCKTTGTDPMTIDVNGYEEPILRRGKANIKEQIAILRRAASQDAQVLVVECMAITPEFQRASQHDILRADIGVITNVRRDHMDVMGDTLPQITEALCHTVPRCGTLLTAETAMAARLKAAAEKNGSRFVCAETRGDEGTLDFPENVALALAVCEELGVQRETALAGMQCFSRDPYALSLYRLGKAIFIGGLSINDIQSICMVWEKLCVEHEWQGKRLTLLINNRGDRASRTEDMLRVCTALCPAEVWLMGASRGYMKRGLKRKLPEVAVRELAGAVEIEVGSLQEDQVIFAIGNIAGDGRGLMDYVRREGSALV